MTEYRYHIYERNRCIFNNLEEEKFKVTWKMLKSLVGPNTTPSNSELSYERVEYLRGIEESY